MKNQYIQLTGAAVLLLLTVGNASAQRRGIRDGGSGAQPEVGIARPQPQVNVAPPQSYNPPAGNDNNDRRGYTPPQRPQPNNMPPQPNGNQPQRGAYNGTLPQGTGNYQRPQPNNAQPQPNNNQPQRGGYNGGRPQMPGNYQGPQMRRGAQFGTARPGGWGFGRPAGIAPGRLGNNRVYRTWPGLPYGRNYITARPQGVYYRNNGYFGSYYAPRIGLSVNVLPYGYYPFYYGPSSYYYSDGFFYQQQNNNYTVVEPPIGAEVKTLPDNAQSITINGVQYYESNGVYYLPVTKDNGSITYEVAGKDGELNTNDANVQDAPPVQVGDLVDNLPEQSRRVNLNGQKYYVTPDGYYLQDAVDDDGTKVYKIISVPTQDADPDDKK